MKILLIEDDLDDIGLLEDALNSHGVPYALETLNDGSSALDYIETATRCPDIIILDFNLPRVHGREVVLRLKSSPSFKTIPLVVLTTSSAREDIEFAYSKGVDKYLTKPNSLAEFARIVETIIRLGSPHSV